MWAFSGRPGLRCLAEKPPSTISAYTVVGWYPFSVGLVASVRAKKYRNLTERLLRDPNSVSQEELNKLRKR